MGDSILDSIKKMLGIDSEYDVFDADIIICINSALFTLMQLGVGPDSGFSITGDSETWNDFLGDFSDLESVKLYVYMKTKIAFDPPQNSTVLKAYNESCSEYEWRLTVQIDNYHS